jgi:hypothetical protein
VHLGKAAAKSHRLDEAGLRKRAATRGDALVEVKSGDEVKYLTLGWKFERYIKIERSEERLNGKKPAASRKAAAPKKAIPKKKAPVKKAAARKTPAAKKKTPAKKKGKK